MDVWQWSVRRGRVPRRVWWLQYVLPFLLAPSVAADIDEGLGLPLVGLKDESGTMVFGPWGPLELMVFLFFTVSGFFASLARMHDSGHSAWWLVLLLPPFVLPLALVLPALSPLALLAMLGIFRGDPGTNRYGPAPAPWRRPRLPTAFRRPRETA